MNRPGLSLDSGALIAIERGDPFVRALMGRALKLGTRVHVVPEVVAQVWRGGSQQARLAKFLKANEVRYPPMTFEMARAVGEVCGRSGHRDVVDVHVVVDAVLHDHQVVTADAHDLRRVDPTLAIIEV